MSTRDDDAAKQRAKHTKDVLQAVDRRLEDFRCEQAMKRREHLVQVKALLHEHRSDVFADVAKLMQSNGVTN